MTNYDIFLGGPPDRRAPFPYKQLIKEAFPGLRIYDWEDYQGDDYQEHNDQMLEQSVMMVSLVPSFPMPGIGPELGYFYRHHKTRIKASLAGICISKEPDETADPNEVMIPPLKLKHTQPINCIILIWPDSVQPDFTKKTIAHYGLIVPTIEETIKVIKNNLEALEQLEQ